MTLLPFQDYLPKALKPLKCCHAHIVAKGYLSNAGVSVPMNVKTDYQCT